MPRRAVILDLDGTLVDSRADIAIAANAARASIGLAPLPLADVLLHVGDGAARLIAGVTPDADADQRAVATVAFQEAYAQGCCQATAPYPGIIAALAGLAAAGWALGVATNKPLGYARRILDHCALAPFIAAVHGGDRLRKPDPAPLHAVLAMLGADAAGSWMAGDHHTDCDAGHAAGCRVLWCAWGFGDRAGRAVDAEAATPADLVAALR